MRKITEEACWAFLAGHEFRSGNTVVKLDADHGNDDEPYVSLYLHGNEIARRFLESGLLLVRTCGYDTTTTKERLKGLPGVQVYHVNRQLYLNGRRWTDHENWTEVHPPERKV
jgi:hypothetical protein